jgi:hypothetical protein
MPDVVVELFKFVRHGLAGFRKFLRKRVIFFFFLDHLQLVRLLRGYGTL